MPAAPPVSAEPWASKLSSLLHYAVSSPGGRAVSLGSPWLLLRESQNSAEMTASETTPSKVRVQHGGRGGQSRGPGLGRMGEGSRRPLFLKQQKTLH